MHRSMHVHWCGHQAHDITKIHTQVHLTSSAGDRSLFNLGCKETVPLVQERPKRLEFWESAFP